MLENTLKKEARALNEQAKKEIEELVQEQEKIRETHDPKSKEKLQLIKMKLEAEQDLRDCSEQILSDLSMAIGTFAESATSIVSHTSNTSDKIVGIGAFMGAVSAAFATTGVGFGFGASNELVIQTLALTFLGETTKFFLMDSIQRANMSHTISSIKFSSLANMLSLLAFVRNELKRGQVM